MKPDAKIREDVIRQLQWDAQVPDPDAIGVAVKDGAATLTGHVANYAQKLAAAHAAERVPGVKAVADELTVHLPGERDDEDIARTVAHVLTSNIHLPQGKVHAQVKNRWVTLEGEVDDPRQRSEVERLTRNVHGITGITNNIRPKTPPPPPPPHVHGVGGMTNSIRPKTPAPPPPPPR
jgi:osmotically-inducible protein OsmY